MLKAVCLFAKFSSFGLLSAFFFPHRNLFPPSPWYNCHGWLDVKNQLSIDLSTVAVDWSLKPYINCFLDWRWKLLCQQINCWLRVSPEGISCRGAGTELMYVTDTCSNPLKHANVPRLGRRSERRDVDIICYLRSFFLCRGNCPPIPCASLKYMSGMRFVFFCVHSDRSRAWK